MAVNCQLLDPAEAAARSRFSLKTIYRAIHAGELRAHKVRSRWRIALADLDAWASGATNASAPSVSVTPATGSLAALRAIEAEAA
jgi:excisionase family DNA binding protein